MAYTSLKSQKRIIKMLLACLIVASVLVIRLIYIQVIKQEYYTQKAYEQQTRQREVAAKRGTIYDATGKKVLAQSVSTNVITVVPNNIDSDKKEQVALKLAQILEMSSEEILTKLKKKTSSEKIASKVDEDKANAVLEYINEENISGIRVDEDTKRVYPYGTLMAHVLGFVGTDNQGLYGIEKYYDESLSGVPGKIVGSTDVSGRETPFTNEQYIDPIDGKDIVLTIDATIQSITEKYLTKVVTENQAEYGMAVVIRPSTGEVLALANSPTFDPNDPFTPNTDELKEAWDTLTSKEKSDALTNMWINKTISNTAEPGSTFKIVTAAAALEENVTTIDKAGDFSCTGSMKIGTWNIKCWRSYNPHGSESLRQGIMNSCNPVFMQVSQRIGIATYCKYLEAFNLYSKTGIDLPGEASSIMHDPDTMTAVDLATTSFGQTISISTLQTAVNYCAIANGGYMIKPYVVKEIKSSSGNYEKQTTSQVLKQIMSQTTSESILSALEDTVSIGTGKGAKVNGYRVAGKTATGEQGRGENKKYMAGFAGIAPVNNPELVVVVNVFGPQGEAGHGGGTICAPIVGSIIDESLRYLDIAPDYTIEESAIKEKVVPNIVGLTFANAKEVLSSEGFSIASDSKIEDGEIIKSQIPKSGAALMEGSTIRAYVSDEAKETTSVPDVRNMTLTRAIEKLKSSGLNVRVVGSGYVLMQDPSATTTLEKGSIVTIKCVDTTELP